MIPRYQCGSRFLSLKAVNILPYMTTGTMDAIKDLGMGRLSWVICNPQEVRESKSEQGFWYMIAETALG